MKRSKMRSFSIIIVIALLHLVSCVQGDDDDEPNLNLEPKFDDALEVPRKHDHDEACLRGKHEKNCSRHADFVDNSEPLRFPGHVPHQHDAITYTQLQAMSGRHLEYTYPRRPMAIRALKTYEEPPYPIPIGVTMFFCIIFLVFLSWYLQRLFNCIFRKTANTLALHPDIPEFPKVNIYSLQKSKDEAKMHGEARNTLSWLAKTYILLHNDPKVNIDVFKTTWSDFDLPQSSWGVAPEVIKASDYMKTTPGDADDDEDEIEDKGMAKAKARGSKTSTKGFGFKK